MNQGTLFAVRFDLDRLETIGQAVPAIEGIAASSAVTGGAQLAVSSDGTLVYVPGVAGATTRPIDWMTRDGKTSVLRATKADWGNPRFSPDGQKLAIDISDGKQHDIWVYDVGARHADAIDLRPGRGSRPGLDARRPAHRVCVRPGQTRRRQLVLGERRRHRRGHAADRQPGYPEALFVASERQVPGLPSHSRPQRQGPDDPADGGRCRARLDARHAHRVSEHAGERGGADVLAGRPMDRVHLERSRQRIRRLRASVSRPRRPMAHLHGRRHLSPVVGLHARAAVR